MKIDFHPPIIAHRGASALAPENTLAAFLKAKQLGIHWVEFDVMLSASGDVIVMHDEHLDRTTNGRGKVIEYPYRYIKTLDAGSWFDQKYAAEKVPTLATTINFLEREKIAANIEIKSLLGYEALLVKHVVNAVSTFQMPFFISSFSRIVLEEVHRLNENISLGFLMDEWQNDWEEFCIKINAKLVDVNHEILDPHKIKKIKSTHRLLLAYTVDNPIRAKELFASGVDAVFSNCSLMFLESLRTRKEGTNNA